MMQVLRITHALICSEPSSFIAHRKNTEKSLQINNAAIRALCNTRHAPSLRADTSHQSRDLEIKVYTRMCHVHLQQIDSEKNPTRLRNQSLHTHVQRTFIADNNNTPKKPQELQSRDTACCRQSTACAAASERISPGSHPFHPTIHPFQHVHTRTPHKISATAAATRSLHTIIQKLSLPQNPRSLHSLALLLHFLISLHTILQSLSLQRLRSLHFLLSLPQF